MNTWLKTDNDGFAIKVSYSETPPSEDWIQDNEYPVLGRAGFKYKPSTKEWVADSYEKSRSAAEMQVRIRRNTMLAESDWTQNRDVSERIASLWQPYRQALRDITAQSGYPFDVIWPTPPQG